MRIARFAAVASLLLFPGCGIVDNVITNRIEARAQKMVGRDAAEFERWFASQGDNWLGQTAAPLVNGCRTMSIRKPLYCMADMTANYCADARGLITTMHVKTDGYC